MVMRRRARERVEDAAIERDHVSLFGTMRVRILAAVVALLALSAVVSIVVLRSVLRDRLDDEISVALEQEIEEFELLASGTDPSTGEPFGGDITAVFDVYFSREVPDEGETLLALIGEELYRSARAPNVASSTELAGAIDEWLALDERTVGTLGTSAGEARFIALPIDPTTEEPQGAVFVVANFPAFEQSEIDEAVRIEAITQFALILVASVVGLALAGRVLRPLRDLATTARTITATDLTQRIEVHGEDEASSIARAFNEMLERLDSAFETQRAFLDDVSHELRVPLTVVRGNVEVLEYVDDDERVEMIGVATAEIERMNRIVEDLLLLARAERPGFLEVETVDVAEFTADVHRRATALGDRDWQLESSASGRALLDPQRITQAMMQLADNACVHTRAGDRITIGSSWDERLVRFWVHDVGPGIPEGESERIFLRHVRGNARPPGTGLGLGLAIVARIAESHGGQARHVPTEVGARIEIELPVRAEIRGEANDG